MRYASCEQVNQDERYCRFCGALLRDRPSIVCSHCHTHNDTDSRFCKYCASPLITTIVCPDCHAKNEQDSFFCRMCGHRLNNKEEEKAQKYLPEYLNCQVGEHFEFGSYNNSAEGQAAPIEWRVLRRGYNRMLVVARYGIDSRQYHSELEGVTWANCSLRKWLNNTFYYTAFSDQERRCILGTMLSNEDNSEYDTPAGQNTLDNVFLLSLREVNDLFRDDRDRCCRPTPYALNNGAWQFETENENEQHLVGYGWWWLRSPGGTADTEGGDACSACDVDYDGNIDVFGLSVGLGFGLVRPAMVLKI